MAMTFEQLKSEFCGMEIREAEWHQHPNGRGWVQSTATVSATAYVGEDAQVYGNARVYGDALVCGGAQVYGNARVYGDALVCGGAWALNPLHIVGTKHSITTCTHTRIKIGCQEHTAGVWLSSFEKIGKANGYTPDEIAEYGKLLRLAADWLKLKFGNAKPKRDAKGRFVKGGTD